LSSPDPRGVAGLNSDRIGAVADETDMDDIDIEIRDLPVLLLRAREALSMQFREIFLLHDLTDPQWRVLRILKNSPNIGTSQLAHRSQLLGPSLSRIVRDLTHRGLMVRTTDPRDARRAFHALTDAGAKVIEEVSPYFTPIYDDLKARLGGERIIEINLALKTLLDALDFVVETEPETTAADG
jgi:homoprotocatechuate degradation regulator HpaR